MAKAAKMVINGGDEMAFNARTGTHPLPVIDLDSERNTGGEDDGLGYHRNRNKTDGQKDSFDRKDLQNGQLH